MIRKTERRHFRNRSVQSPRSGEARSDPELRGAILSPRLSSGSRARESERGTFSGCKGVISSISTRKMNSVALYTRVEIVRRPALAYCVSEGIKDFVRTNEPEYRRTGRPMTLHSLTGTGIYFPSPEHRRLNGIIIEREFLMALDDLIKCRYDLFLAASLPAYF